MPDLKAENIKRVVVRGTNWVGDAVMTVPALRELRKLLPNAHLTLATRPWARELFADAEFVDDVLISEKRGLRSVVSQVAAWRKRRFDLAVVFPNAFEAALIPFLARVPTRVGYATDGRAVLLTNSLVLPEWRSSRHEVFYYLNIIAELESLLYGNQTVMEKQPDVFLKVSETKQTEGLALLRALGIRNNRPVVALCPGSINSRAKRWPAESYAMLADSLIEKLNADVLLIGSPAEIDVSLGVSDRMRNKVGMLTGKTDMAQVAAVLSQVDLLITNDTGPAHVAAALGRPTLVIFGPTNPLTTRPFPSVAEIVRHPPECAPCMLRDCPIDHRCMTAITPDEIFKRANVMLGLRDLSQETHKHSAA